MTELRSTGKTISIDIYCFSFATCSSSVCLRDDYNKMNMPERINEDPLVVSCGIRLLDITQIDTQDFGFSMSVFLQFIWTDNRVSMEASNKTDENLHLSFIELMWVPDFYIYDLQSFRTYHLLKDIMGGLRARKNNNDTGFKK